MRYLFHVILVALITVSPLAAQSPREIEIELRAAQNMEEVEGNLQGAIEVYRRISESSDRAIAAEALLRMGGAYEKLGSQEAQWAYERVITDYADQTTLAAEAQARLSANFAASAAVTPPTTSTRHVWTPPELYDPFENGNRVSPDGRYHAFTDWITGNLGVHEYGTGEDRLVTTGGCDDPSCGLLDYASGAKWSLDGSQLAYLRWSETGAANDSYELRITDLNDLDSRLLYRHEDVFFPAIGGWSPDGQYLSVGLNRWDGTIQVGILSVSDGSLRVLKSLGQLDLNAAHVGGFSPDGQYFIYDSPRDQTSPNKDLFLMAVDGSAERRLTDTPDNEAIWGLGWTPDGSLLFFSDRTGSNALWFMDIENGIPTGYPSMLNPVISDIRALGITRDGALYYGIRQSESRGTFSVAFDPETAQVIGSATPIVPAFEGAAGDASWSRHSQSLAYVSPDGLLVIRSLESGRETVVTQEVTSPVGARLQWHPDGGSLFARGTYQDREGFLEIDLRTLDAEPRFVADSAGTLSADGKMLYGWERENDPVAGTIRTSILQTDLETGVQSELHGQVSFNSRITYFAPSPDGRTIVYKLSVYPPPPGQFGDYLYSVSTDGGSPAHFADLVYRGEPVMRTNEMAWTPDGNYLLFFGNHGEDRKLFRVAAAGGDLEVAGLIETTIFDEPNVLGRVRMRPDGREIIFNAHWDSSIGAGIWAMENFLPASGGTR